MTRKAKATKRRTDGATGPPVKTAFTLSWEASRRLGIAKVVDGKDQSEIVEELIMSHLQGYFAGRRGRDEDGETEAVA